MLSDTCLLAFKASILPRPETAPQPLLTMSIAGERARLMGIEPFSAVTASALGKGANLPRSEPLARVASLGKASSLPTAKLLLTTPMPVTASESTELTLSTPSAAPLFEGAHLRRAETLAAPMTLATLAAATIHRREATAAAATFPAAHEDPRLAALAATTAAFKSLGRATVLATVAASALAAAGKSGRSASAVRVAAATFAMAFARLRCSGTCDRERCDAGC